MSSYTYPSNYVFQSDNSFIVWRNVTFKDCVPTPPKGSCDLFNATRCGNDECYSQPFISGDVLYFQWRWTMPLSMSFSFAASLVDEDFNAIDYTVPTGNFGVGYDSALQVYQWFYLDTSLIPASVTTFHLKIIYGTGNDEWFSEPFERVTCDEETVLVKGVFTSKKDCYGNYQGDLPNYSMVQNNYISQTRIYGSIEKIGHSVTKEKSEDVEISTTVEQIYLFRSSRKVPQYVADKVAECFSGTTVYVDGEIYTPGGSIDKEFEEGKMWIISSEMTQSCTQENFKCN